MTNAGYSGTPLARKLNLKDGLRVWWEDMPPPIRAEIESWGCRLQHLLWHEPPLDAAHVFVTSRADLESAIQRLRPLLALGRADLLAWARAQGLAWVEDESNADCRYARNALRHRVLPAIEAEFPAAAAALARAADHFREADALLGELAALDEHACGGVLLARDALLALSDARIANLLRWQVRRKGVDQSPMEVWLGRDKEASTRPR